MFCSKTPDQYLGGHDAIHRFDGLFRISLWMYFNRLYSTVDIPWVPLVAGSWDIQLTITAGKVQGWAPGDPFFVEKTHFWTPKVV